MYLRRSTCSSICPSLLKRRTDSLPGTTEREKPCPTLLSYRLFFGVSCSPALLILEGPQIIQWFLLYHLLVTFSVFVCNIMPPFFHFTFSFFVISAPESLLFLASCFCTTNLSIPLLHCPPFPKDLGTIQRNETLWRSILSHVLYSSKIRGSV